MATFEQERDRMRAEYPSLFVVELDVLDHLFFVNGNGFYWVNGALEDRFKDSTFTSTTTAEEQDAERAAELAYRLRMAEPYNSEHISAHNPWSLSENGALRTRIYPLCQYAKTLDLPDNIQPDWLAAAERAIELARGPLGRLNVGDEDWLRPAEERIKQLKARRAR